MGHARKDAFLGIAGVRGSVRPFQKPLIPRKKNNFEAMAGGRMGFRMSRILRFRVDVECERGKVKAADKSGHTLIGEVLLEFEQAGNAMRYLDSEGQVAWKASPRMLARLADAEREAIDDAEHDLP
jgi:hypothetical protein